MTAEAKAQKWNLDSALPSVGVSHVPFTLLLLHLNMVMNMVQAEQNG